MSEQDVNQLLLDTRKRLTERNIPIEQWGVGEAKTLEQLVAEIKAGETVLQEDNGNLVRLVRAAEVFVWYTQGFDRFFLVEDRQEFSGDRIRRRKRASSVAEKMTPYEHPVIAAQRAIREELGITTPVAMTYRGPLHNDRESPSYPGLRSIYDVYAFDAELTAEQYRKEGYIEKKEEMTTYFIWRPVGRG
jgi:8-oxo-dGTP pyrophosphatase MutT (NUDIX family)